MLFAEGRFSRFDDDTDDHETTFISRLGGLNYWVNNLPITYFYFCLKKLHFKSSEWFGTIIERLRMLSTLFRKSNNELTQWNNNKKISPIQKTNFY